MQVPRFLPLVVVVAGATLTVPIVLAKHVQEQLGAIGPHSNAASAKGPQPSRAAGLGRIAR